MLVKSSSDWLFFSEHTCDKSSDHLRAALKGYSYPLLRGISRVIDFQNFLNPHLEL